MAKRDPFDTGADEATGACEDAPAQTHAQRYQDIPGPGPTAVCQETLPDGTGAIRLSFAILVF